MTETTRTLDIGAAVMLGWRQMKAQFLIWVGVLAVLFVVNLIPQGATIFFDQAGLDSPALAIPIILVGWILSVLLQLGMIKVSLVSADGDQPKLGLLFSQHKLLLRFIGASILYGLIVMVGLLLLVVPGIIWAIKYQFFGYLIVDRDLSVFEALHESGTITKGVKWRLLGLGILLAIINFIGALLLMIGLLATIPTTQIALAAVYRQLTPALQSAPPPAAEPGKMV